MTIEPPKEIEVTIGKGVSGTIAVPYSVDSEHAYQDGVYPATHKIALILHGQGGHRNYCYQKLLAHRLAKELGIYSLRIDFRGCGSSGDNETEELGRVLSQDVDDIQACAEFLIDGTKNPLGIDFTLSSIVAHSRGSLATFLWAIKQDNISKSDNSAAAIIVPNLVNCSSRYQSHTVLERYPVGDGSDFVEVPQTMLRHGKYQGVPIKRQELLDLATADLSPLNDLSTEVSVLSIYGLEDTIIPIVDCSHFANRLTRGPLSHKLELVPMADHNFFGVVPIETESDAEEFNPLNLPINSSKLVNFSAVVVDKIIDYLDPKNEFERFLVTSRNIGHLSRWKQVDGISNFRDIGGWRITSPRFPLEGDPSPSKYYVRHNLMFRSAHLGNTTEEGLKTMKDLGIKVIFDLRSEGECSRDGFPEDLGKYGMKRLHTPVYSKDDYSPQAIVVRYSNLMISWDTYVNVYDDMLTHGVHAFKTIFEFIRDNKDTPFLFHCTAGKDRTGVFAMLVLSLIGLDKHLIAKEYELTTLGLKPDHKQIQENFMKIVQSTKSKLDEPSLFEKLITKGRTNWSIEKDGFENLISSKYEAMLLTLDLLNNNYGGVINYFTEYMKFNQDDILQIYNNVVMADKIGFFRENTFIEWNHRNSMGPNL